MRPVVVSYGDCGNADTGGIYVMGPRDPGNNHKASLDRNAEDSKVQG